MRKCPHGWKMYKISLQVKKQNQMSEILKSNAEQKFK